MLVVRCGKERTARAQILDDLLVRLEDKLTGVGPRFLGEVPGSIDRIENRQSILHAGVEVVGTMTRRRMHRARSGFEIDVVGEHHERIAIHEWMTHAGPVETFARNARKQLRVRKSFAERLLRKRRGENQQFIVEPIKPVGRIGA